MPPPGAETLDRRIAAAHDRFQAAMVARLPALGEPEKETYLQLLATLADKLERKEKPLRQVLQESVGALLPLVMQALAAS